MFLRESYHSFRDIAHQATEFVHIHNSAPARSKAPDYLKGNIRFTDTVLFVAFYVKKQTFLYCLLR